MVNFIHELSCETGVYMKYSSIVVKVGALLVYIHVVMCDVFSLSGVEEERSAECHECVLWPGRQV